MQADVEQEIKAGPEEAVEPKKEQEVVEEER
jgi:hypothetical protein